MQHRHHRLAGIARRQLGLFTFLQARAVGFSPAEIRHGVRSGRWACVEAGVYLVNGSPVTPLTMLMAACLRTDGVASHRSSAALHGLDGFSHGRREITVSRRAKHRPLGAIIHSTTQFDLLDVVRIDGVPTTGPARLVADLGSVVSYDRYQAAFDELVSRRLLTIESATESLVRHSRRGRAGIGALRTRLLDQGRGVPASALERAFVTLVAVHRLAAPVLQHTIHDAEGFVARVDAAYPAAKVAIELDGRSFHERQATFEADRVKRNRLQADGWVVFELTWEQLIEGPALIAERIRRALTARLPRAAA